MMDVVKEIHTVKIACFLKYKRRYNLLCLSDRHALLEIYLMSICNQDIEITDIVIK